jgi:hypothetical protein
LATVIENAGVVTNPYQSVSRIVMLLYVPTSLRFGRPQRRPVVPSKLAQYGLF